MVDLATYGITLADVRKYLNPTLDPNGIQVGNLFSLTSVDSTIARVDDRTLKVNTGLGSVGANQLQGYKIFINGNNATFYTIYTNSYANISDNTVLIGVMDDLPDAGGDWSIVCRSTRVDLLDADAMNELTNAAREVDGLLRDDYSQMCREITGLLLWPREYMGYPGTGEKSFQLPFYKATNVRVWHGHMEDYSNRARDARQYESGTEYTLTHDDTLHTSTLTILAPLREGETVTVDFRHDLDPCPGSLLDWARMILLARVLRWQANIQVQTTQGASALDLAKALRADVKEQIDNGVPELDTLNLYQETKLRPRTGIGNIDLLRG